MKTFTTTLLAFLLLVPPAFAASTPVGYIASTTGDVLILKEDGSKVVPSEAQEIFPGDALRTAAKARAKVLFSDDSVLSLGENSEVRISEYLLEEEKKSRRSVISMARGVLRLLVSTVFSGSGSRFEVRTETAVAGVRGTEFAVDLAGGAFKVYTFEGEVEVSGITGGAAVPVKAGEFSRLDEAGRPVAAVAAAAADLGRLAQSTEVTETPRAVAFAVETSPFEELPGLGIPAAAGMSGGSQENVAQQQAEGATSGGGEEKGFPYLQDESGPMANGDDSRITNSPEPPDPGDDQRWGVHIIIVFKKRK